MSKSNPQGAKPQLRKPSIVEALAQLGVSLFWWRSRRRRVKRRGLEDGRTAARLVGFSDIDSLREDAVSTGHDLAARFPGVDGGLPTERAQGVVFTALFSAYMDGWEEGFSRRPAPRSQRRNARSTGQRAGRYTDSSGDVYFIPPVAAVENAQMAVDAIEEGSDAMTSTGRNRMRQLAGRKRLSAQDLIEIDNWFARHSEYVSDHTPPPSPSNSWVSWKGWGGDEMRAFAAHHRQALDRENPNGYTSTATRAQLKAKNADATRAAAASTKRATTASTYRAIGRDIKKTLGNPNVLDVGSGSGEGAAALRRMGLDVTTYEPHPSADAQPDAETRGEVAGRYGAVVVSYVLNVVPQDERDAVVRFALSHAEDGGRVYFVVRSRSSVASMQTGDTLSADHERLYESGTYQYGFGSGELLAYLEDLTGATDSVETFPAGDVAAVVSKGGRRENPRANVTTRGAIRQVARQLAVGVAQGTYGDEIRILGTVALRQAAENEGLQPGDIDRLIELAPEILPYRSAEGTDYPELTRAADEFGLEDLPDYRTSRGYYSDTQMREEVEGFIVNLPILRDPAYAAKGQWKEDLPVTGWNFRMATDTWDPTDVLYRSMRFCRSRIERFTGEVTKERVLEAIERYVLDVMRDLAAMMTFFARRSYLYDEDADLEEIARDLRVADILLVDSDGINFRKLFENLMDWHGLEVGDDDVIVSRDADVPDVPDLTDVRRGRVSVAEAVAARERLEQAVEDFNTERAERADRSNKRGFAQLWDFASWYVGNGWATDHGPTISQKVDVYNEEHADDPTLEVYIHEEYYGPGDRYIRVRETTGDRDRLLNIRPHDQHEFSFWKQLFPVIAFTRLELAANGPDERFKVARREAISKAAEYVEAVEEGEDVETVPELFERVTRQAQEYDQRGGAPEEPEADEATGYESPQIERAVSGLLNAARFGLGWIQKAPDLRDPHAFKKAFDAYFDDDYRLQLLENDQTGEIDRIRFEGPEGTFLVSARPMQSAPARTVREFVANLAVAAQTIEQQSNVIEVSGDDLTPYQGQQSRPVASQASLVTPRDFEEYFSLEPVDLEVSEIYGWPAPKDVDPSDVPDDDRQYFEEIQRMIHRLEEAGKDATGIKSNYLSELYFEGDDAGLNIEFLREQFQNLISQQEEENEKEKRRERSLRGDFADVERTIRDEQWVRDWIAATYKRADRGESVPAPILAATTHAYNLVNAALAEIGLLPGDVDVPSQHERGYEIENSRWLLLGTTRKLGSHQYKIDNGWKNASPERVEEQREKLTRIYSDVEEATRDLVPQGLPSPVEVRREVETTGRNPVNYTQEYYERGPAPGKRFAPVEEEYELIPALAGIEQRSQLREQVDLAHNVIEQTREEYIRRREGNVADNKALTEQFAALQKAWRNARVLGNEDVDFLNLTGLRLTVTEYGEDAMTLEVYGYENRPGSYPVAQCIVIDVHPESNWALRAEDNASWAPSRSGEGVMEERRAGTDLYRLMEASYPEWRPRFIVMPASNFRSARLPNGTAQAYALRKPSRDVVEDARADRDAFNRAVFNTIGRVDEAFADTAFERFVSYIEDGESMRFTGWLDAWSEYSPTVLPDLMQEADGLSAERIRRVQQGQFARASELIAADPPADEETDEELDDDDLSDSDLEAGEADAEEAEEAEKVATGDVTEEKRRIAERLEDDRDDLVSIMQQWARSGGSIAGFAADDLNRIQAIEEPGKRRERLGNWAGAWLDRARVDVGLDPVPVMTPAELRASINEEYQQGDRGDYLPDDMAQLVSDFLAAYWEYHSLETSNAYYLPQSEDYHYLRSGILQEAQRLASRSFKFDRGDKNASRRKIAESRRKIISDCLRFRRFTDIPIPNLDTFEEELPEQEGFTPGDVPDTLPEGTAVLREYLAFIEGEEDALRSRLARYKSRFAEDGNPDSVQSSLAAHLLAHATFHAPDSPVKEKQARLVNEEGAPLPSDVIAEIAGVRVSAMQAMHATDLRAMLDDSQEGDSPTEADPATDVTDYDAAEGESLEEQDEAMRERERSLTPPLETEIFHDRGYSWPLLSAGGVSKVPWSDLPKWARIAWAVWRRSFVVANLASIRGEEIPTLTVPQWAEDNARKQKAKRERGALKQRRALDAYVRDLLPSYDTTGKEITYGKTRLNRLFEEAILPEEAVSKWQLDTSKIIKGWGVEEPDDEPADADRDEPSGEMIDPHAKLDEVRRYEQGMHLRSALRTVIEAVEAAARRSKEGSSTEPLDAIRKDAEALISSATSGEPLGDRGTVAKALRKDTRLILTNDEGEDVALIHVVKKRAESMAPIRIHAAVLDQRGALDLPGRMLESATWSDEYEGEAEPIGYVRIPEEEIGRLRYPEATIEQAEREGFDADADVTFATSNSQVLDYLEANGEAVATGTVLMSMNVSWPRQIELNRDVIEAVPPDEAEGVFRYEDDLMRLPVNSALKLERAGEPETVDVEGTEEEPRVQVFDVPEADEDDEPADVEEPETVDVEAAKEEGPRLEIVNVETNAAVKDFLSEYDIVLASGEATTEDGAEVRLDRDLIRDTDHKYYVRLGNVGGRIKITPGYAWDLEAVDVSEAVKERVREEEEAEDLPGDDPPVSTSFEIRDVPIGEIKTDEERFQPREASYSEATAEKIAEDFDPNLFDPVDLWRDPDDGELYMLAGHSRLEGMKRRGAETIPAEIKDFDEESAIRYALIENDKGTNLTNRERATVVRRLRETGELDTITAQRDFAKENYDRNATVVFDLSWLDPNGKALSVLGTMETTGGQDYKDAETMAQWVGKIMRVHRDDFERSHENEIFNFLLDNYKTKGKKFTSYIEFREFIDEAKARVSGMGAFNGFDADQPLNLEQIVPKTQQEQRIDEEVQEKREALKEARKELDEKRQDLAEAKASGEDVTEEDFERILAPYERAVRGAQQKLIQAEQEADKARKQVKQSQPGLFAAARENTGEIPVSLVHIGRVSKFVVDGPDGRIPYAAGAHPSYMYMTHRGDALVIVPALYVEEVPEDDAAAGSGAADDAWEEWHHMKPQGGDHNIEVPAGPGEHVGTARRIHYESDKLMEPGDRRGKRNAYYHDFEDGHAVREYDMPRGGLVLTIGGLLGDFDGLALLDSEGTLQIDGRGILN